MFSFFSMPSFGHSPIATDRVRRPTLAAAILLCVGLGQANAQAQTQAQQLRDGILIDRAQQTAILMTPTGVDAVNLRFGLLRWRSEVQGRPLLASGDYVLVQERAADFGTLTIAVLDRSSGRLERRVQTALPEDVIARLEDSPSTTFVTSAQPARDGGADVFWRYRYRVAQGFRSAGGDRSPAQIREGALNIDPASGVVRPATGLATQRAAWEVPASQGNAQAGRSFRSLATEHTLTSVRNQSQDLDRQYTWTIRGARNETLGTFDSAMSFAPFAVVDSLVVFETPERARREEGAMVAEGPKLRGVSLSNGVEQWSWPLRPIKYRGVMPP